MRDGDVKTKLGIEIIDAMMIMASTMWNGSEVNGVLLGSFTHPIFRL